MWQSMLSDLASAENFIFMEYFIIEEGAFWNSILEILKAKAAAGVMVRVLYDDIGCMTTLPGNYYKTLKTYGIDAIPFSRLRGAPIVNSITAVIGKFLLLTAKSDIPVVSILQMNISIRWKNTVIGRMSVFVLKGMRCGN